MKKHAKHFDGGKPEYQYLFTLLGLDEVAKVGTFGAGKYGQYNYKSGMPWMKLLGSCCRHLLAFIKGEDYDVHTLKCKNGCNQHSGLHHMAHLCFDALMLLEYSVTHKDLDDRYKK